MARAADRGPTLPMPGPPPVDIWTVFWEPFSRCVWWVCGSETLFVVVSFCVFRERSGHKESSQKDPHSSEEL